MVPLLRKKTAFKKKRGTDKEIRCASTTMHASILHANANMLVCAVCIIVCKCVLVLQTPHASSLLIGKLL